MELLIVASAAALAAGCLVCLGIGPRRPCDVVTGSVAVTLALMVSLAKVLLLLGVFRPGAVTIAALVAAGGAAGWLLVDHGAGERARSTARMMTAAGRRIRFSLVGVVAAGVIVIIVVFESAMGVRLPPVAWDSLYYHLISVAEWVRTGHFVAPLPGLSRHNQIYIYYQADSFPKDAELTASWLAVFTHSTELVGLSQVLYMPLLVGGMYGILRHLDVRAGLAFVAAAIVTMTPALIQELGTNYVDVAAAAAVLAGFQFLVSAFPATPLDEDPIWPKVRALILAGIAFGLAAGIKPTDLEYCAAGLILVVGLCVRETRRQVRAAGPAGPDDSVLPSPGRCLLALGIPMLALGSFWYIRSWFVWGSPVWPIQIGPFPGVVSATTWTNVGGLAIPVGLRNSSGLMLLARSWITPGVSLGDIWIYVLLPAIGVATILAARRRRLMPVLSVVLPLFVLDAISPGAWQTRFEFEMVAAGAIALALVCESVARHQAVTTAARAASAAIAASASRLGAHRRAAEPRQPTGPIGLARRFIAASAAATALCLAASTAWAAANTMGGWQAGPDVSLALKMMRDPAATRAQLAPWNSYDVISKYLKAPGAVAFFSNSPPNWVLPFAGLDFSRGVVVLSAYQLYVGATETATGQPLAAPHETELRATQRFHFAAEQMRALGARYLYVQAGTAVYEAIVERYPAQIVPVVAVPQGEIFELVSRTGVAAGLPRPVPAGRTGRSRSSRHRRHGHKRRHHPA
jgi:hypothetical protein